MSLETVIEQNNITVSLLNAQDFSHAVVASTQALRYQKASLSSHPDLIAPDDTFTDELDQWVILSSQFQQRRDDIESNNFIYDRAILIPDGLTNQDSASAILIFNAALAYQLLAGTVSAQNQCVQFLTKAKSLYELGYNMQPTKHTVLFQFAILNNIAVIERDLGNEATSKNYFDDLWSFWIVTVALNQGSTLQLRYMRGFLSNILGETRDIAHAA